MVTFGDFWQQRHSFKTIGKSEITLGEMKTNKKGSLLKMLNIRETKKKQQGSSCHGAVEMNPTRNHEIEDSIPRLNQWVEDLLLP